MRILHTSDWHLGVNYYQLSRLEEQWQFLEWLLETVEELEVDVLIVAGDIFDTPAPPTEALAFYYRFLSRLSGMGVQAIVIGGNHDSPSRLDAPRELLECLSIDVIGGYDAHRQGEHAFAEGRLIPIERPGAAPVVVAGVPYLNDWKIGVRLSEMEDEAAELRSLETAFREIYSRLADEAERLFPGLPLIGTGHLTVLPQAGAQPSEEDAIPYPINRVGHLGAMGPGIFDPRYDYVALGHIHRQLSVDPQRSGRVSYSGTPLQVSSKEPADTRKVILIDIEEGGALSRQLISVPVFRRLVSWQGSIEALEARLQALTWEEGELPPYLRLDIEGETLLPSLTRRLRELMPEGPGGQAQLAHLRALRIEGQTLGEAPPPVASLTPDEVFRYAWANYKPGSPLDSETMALFQSLIHADP